MPNWLINASKYLLAIAGVTVISIVILDSWFGSGVPPSLELLIALIVFALLPVADRIKIFDWIDFRKSISDVETEVSQARSQIEVLNEGIQQLNSNISSSVSTKQIVNNISI